MQRLAKRAVAVAAVCLMAGCGHRPPVPPPQLVEDAYVDRRPVKPMCGSDDLVCCAQGVAAAREAGRNDNLRAARLWHEVAVTCPARRDEAAAVLRAPAGPAAPAPPDGASAARINVSFRFQLPPHIRLYWLAAWIGDRLLPASPAPAASASPAQPLQIEVQAIRFRGGQPGPLLRMEATLELPAEPGALVTVDIVESGDPAPGLAPRVRIEKPARAPAAPPAAPPRPPAPGPDLEPARLVRLDTARLPRELGPGLRGARFAVRACLDAEGRLDTVRLLDPTHPRLAASIADALRDARWEPYRVDSRAMPSCQPVTVAF